MDNRVTIAHILHTTYYILQLHRLLRRHLSLTLSLTPSLERAAETATEGGTGRVRKPEGGATL